MTSWSEITVTPTADAVSELRDSWSWLLGTSWRPLLFSAIGDVFLQLPAGTVWWLSTPIGSLEQVADSETDFNAKLMGEQVDEWFLPGLVEALRSSGKLLLPGQCYSYTTLPVFDEGSFSVENMYAIDAKEHFGVTGNIMKQIQALPDGSKVSIKMVE